MYCCAYVLKIIDVPVIYHCGNSDCECGEKCVDLIIAY